MSSAQESKDQKDQTDHAWPAILTWRAHNLPRMESVRVQLSGNRIKAYGRIVSAATETTPAFSASYDLVTDEAGGTKRLSMTVTLAERERQLSIARDEENMWLVQDPTGQTSRAAYDGALLVTEYSADMRALVEEHGVDEAEAVPGRLVRWDDGAITVVTELVSPTSVLVDGADAIVSEEFPGRVLRVALD